MSPNRSRAIVRLAACLFAALCLASPAGAQEAPSAPAAPSAPEISAPAAAMEYAVLRTNRGDIVIELDRAKAPISVDNFLAYVKDGFYDGTVFHRVVPGFVIQGGGFDQKGAQKPTKAPIKNEWRNGLKNLRGTLSMARTNAPDSATSQFFISLKDNDSLDQPISGGAGYAVFGRVVAGMDVVDAIAALPRGTRNGMRDWPTQDALTMKVETISKDEAERLVKAASKAATPAGAAPTNPAAPSAPATPAAPK